MDRPVLKDVTAMVPPQFLYGAELLYLSGKDGWDAEEGKTLKSVLSLPKSSMVQAVRLETGTTSWGITACMALWQRQGMGEEYKISQWCRNEVLKRELSWAKGTREIIIKACRMMRLKLCPLTL